jgi:hypothetical protein
MGGSRGDVGFRQVAGELVEAPAGGRAVRNPVAHHGGMEGARMGFESVIEAWLSRFKRRREAGVLGAQEAQPDRAAAIGALGEALVAGVLRDMGWPMLRNVVLRERGRSSEIDLIARAPAAIAVLEVKTWSGFIQGEARAASWTRHGKGNEVMAMPSAVIQNHVHVAAVERAIGDHAVAVWGLVVSAGHARFAAPLRPHVVDVSVIGTVLQAEAIRGRWCDPHRLDRAWARLRREAERSPGRREAHVAWLRSRERAARICE